MDVREQYYKIIKDNNIPNVLVELVELPYSRKLKILNELLIKFELSVVKLALNLYKLNYIDVKRVNLFVVRNTLISICTNLKASKNY